MFTVLFEVTPRADQWDAYLGYAQLLRPDLIRIDGFIDNTRYRSLHHPGRVLSLSTWRDEKALIRWRTQALHNDVQGKGRLSVFQGYHLRVGQVTFDSALGVGERLRDLRMDETETGEAKAVMLLETTGTAPTPPRPHANLADWDAFEAILTPGMFLLMLSLRQPQMTPTAVAESRVRMVRVIRDYGMFDRREAPQYFPPGD
jgi:heme-degrading monooxygenase HmoA